MFAKSFDLVKRFNTQPPEGGWLLQFQLTTSLPSFNTQPPEGGWFILPIMSADISMFQHTAARRRLAMGLRLQLSNYQFQHTAARRRLGFRKAADKLYDGFNTQPPEGGWLGFKHIGYRDLRFQHTAARRRLAV